MESYDLFGDDTAKKDQCENMIIVEPETEVPPEDASHENIVSEEKIVENVHSFTEDIYDEKGISEACTKIMNKNEYINCAGVSEEKIKEIISNRENVTKEEYCAIKESLDNISKEMAKFINYGIAVDTLRKSVTANHDNEEKLRKELDYYKNDELFKKIKPFLEMVVQMHMELKKSKAEYENSKTIEELGETTCREIVETHDYLIGMVESQMSVQGIEVKTYSDGDDYNPVDQMIIKTVPADEPSKVGKVAACKTDAYTYDGKVLQKSRVYCYK